MKKSVQMKFVKVDQYISCLLRYINKNTFGISEKKENKYKQI